MIIKIAFLYASILAVTATAPVGIAVHNTGVSSTSKHQDSHGNYEFSYDIVDEHGASNSRSEVGDAFGNKKGSYSLYDTDGRARTVDYIADEHGFRVVVNTNEPGTAQSYPDGAIINSPYQHPAAPNAAPVSIVHDVPAPVSAHVPPVSTVHDVPAPVSAHVAPVSHPIKSVLSHPAPTATFDYAAPVAVAHAVPTAYSTKSVISHDAPTHVAEAVAYPYAYSVPLAYKSVVPHAAAPVALPTPLSYSTKSVVSRTIPVQTIAHASPVAIASPAHISYTPKSVISNVVPVAKHYATAPATVGSYRSTFNGGLGFGNSGYSHGLLGPRFHGLSYNTKLYNHGLQRLKKLMYGNNFGHRYHGYGSGFLGPYMGRPIFGNDIYGFNGLKSYYY